MPAHDSPPLPVRHRSHGTERVPGAWPPVWKVEKKSRLLSNAVGEIKTLREAKPDPHPDPDPNSN